MADDLMAWLRRLYDRLRYPGQSVQYELQRMTPQGGWVNANDFPGTNIATAYPTPPPQPSFDSGPGRSPGRYRCVKRVNGRIEATLWTVESSDADAYYARLREQAAAEESPAAEESRTANPDGGTATASDDTADTSAADSDATAADHDALTQRLMTETADGSRTAALGLGMLELLDDDGDAADDSDDSRE